MSLVNKDYQCALTYRSAKLVGGISSEGSYQSHDDGTPYPIICNKDIKNVALIVIRLEDTRLQPNIGFTKHCV